MIKTIVQRVVTFLAVLVAVVGWGLFLGQTAQHVSAQSGISDGVAFEIDGTISDPEPGQLAEPLLVGSTVYKNWTVRNTGNEQWYNRKLVVRYAYTVKDFKDKGLHLRDYLVSSPVPDLRVGESGNVSVAITVPLDVGEYTAFFGIVKTDESRDILTVAFRAVTK